MESQKPEANEPWTHKPLLGILVVVPGRQVSQNSLSRLVVQEVHYN